jgi:hypothetical protein
MNVTKGTNVGNSVVSGQRFLSNKTAVGAPKLPVSNKDPKQSQIGIVISNMKLIF